MQKVVIFLLHIYIKILKAILIRLKLCLQWVLKNAIIKNVKFSWIYLSLCISANSGSSHPSVHSQWVSRKVITSPLEAAAPEKKRKKTSTQIRTNTKMHRSTSSKIVIVDKTPQFSYGCCLDHKQYVRHLFIPNYVPYFQYYDSESFSFYKLYIVHLQNIDDTPSL